MKKKKIILILCFILFIAVILIYVKTNNKNSNINFQYIKESKTYTLNNNEKIDIDTTPISITWNNESQAIITYPNNEKSSIDKNTSLSLPGKYSITLNKTTINFELVQDTIDSYTSFDPNNNTITFKNLENIESISIDQENFSKESNNLPKSYTFSKRGRYTLTIVTSKNKTFKNQYTIR